MTYRCSQCGADLKPGDTQCAACGKTFDPPVPLEPAAMRDDDILRRSAASRYTEQPKPFHQSSTAPFAMPLKPKRRMSWVAVAVVAVVVILGVLSGGYTLLMAGPFGDSIYMAHNNAGNDALGRSDFTTAYNEYGDMIAMRPHQIDGYLLRCILDQKAGWYSRAVDDATSGLDCTRNAGALGNLYENRAHSYAQLAMWKLAIRDYTSAMHEYSIDADPDESSHHWAASALRSRAEAYWQRKSYALGIADCDSLVGQPNPQPEDYAVRAQCEMALGNNRAAQSDFRAAIKIDPSYLPAYAYLGEIADQSHNYAAVIAIYQQAILENPYNPDLRGGLGWYQYEDGQINPAIDNDKKALALGPSRMYIVDNLALCYAVTGDKADAASTYAVALSNEDSSTKAGAFADLHHAIAAHPGSPVLAAELALNETGDIPPGPHTLPASITKVEVVAAPAVPAAYDKLLGSDTTEVGYVIRPPLGYTFSHTHEEYTDGYKIIDLWTGPARPDGTVPTLQITLNFDDGGYAASHSNQQAEQAVMDDTSANHTPFSQTAATPVSFGTCDFAKGTWTGTGVKTGKIYTGTIYSCARSGEYIGLETHDAFPYAATTTPLLCAAAETFRRTGDQPWQPDAGAR